MAPTHLFEDGRVLSTYDFVRKETSVYEDHYHGEAVLSIIAGKIDGEYRGSAPMASFHLLIIEIRFHYFQFGSFGVVRINEPMYIYEPLQYMSYS